MQYLQNLFILYLNGKFAFLLCFYNQHIPAGSAGGEVEIQLLRTVKKWFVS